MSEFSTLVDETKPKYSIKVLVGNKMDVGKKLPQEEVDHLISTYKFAYFPISAKTGEGVPELMAYLEKQIDQRIGKKEIEPDEEGSKGVKAVPSFQERTKSFLNPLVAIQSAKSIKAKSGGRDDCCTLI